MNIFIFQFYKKLKFNESDIKIILFIMAENIDQAKCKIINYFTIHKPIYYNILGKIVCDYEKNCDFDYSFCIDKNNMYLELFTIAKNEFDEAINNIYEYNQNIFGTIKTSYGKSNVYINQQQLINDAQILRKLNTLEYNSNMWKKYNTTLIQFFYEYDEKIGYIELTNGLSGPYIIIDELKDLPENIRNIEANTNTSNMYNKLYEDCILKYSKIKPIKFNNRINNKTSNKISNKIFKQIVNYLI
nr:ankyrin repeat domain containing protein [Mimivirus sp.]